jgi:hypothetical protein
MDGNIKMDLQVIGWEGVDWIGLSQEWSRGELMICPGSMKCREFFT